MKTWDENFLWEKKKKRRSQKQQKKRFRHLKVDTKIMGEKRSTSWSFWLFSEQRLKTKASFQIQIRHSFVSDPLLSLHEMSEVACLYISFFEHRQTLVAVDLKFRRKSFGECLIALMCTSIQCEINRLTVIIPNENDEREKGEKQRWKWCGKRVLIPFENGFCWKTPN